VLETNNKLVHIIGCGSLGKKLIPLLLSRLQTKVSNIYALVKTKESQKDCCKSGVQSFAFDLDKENQSLPEGFMSNCSVLYYFAPPPGSGNKDSRVRSFINLLAKDYPEQASLKKVKKIILISTTGVYGHCSGEWVNEKTALNPQVDRAKRRVDAEQQFHHFCLKYQIPLITLRVSGIYGPGKLPLKRIKEKTPMVRQEDSPFSNRIHVDDLLEIFLKAGFSEKIEGIFNCSDGHPSTMYDYFKQVAQVHHLPIPPVINIQQAKKQLSAGMLSYMAESRRINNSKLLSVFNLVLKYPDLESGLKQIKKTLKN
jgi:nucleoside-diphosphate-sugar epimerase